jgi:hypothetical protein
MEWRRQKAVSRHEKVKNQKTGTGWPKITDK